jgi:DNA-binding MarR family transcriptional regulator
MKKAWKDEHMDADATTAVLVASRALVGVAARSLAAIEDTITLVQYRALVLLASAGDLNVGSLAEALDIHQSTATRLCDRLATKGLIERTTSESSRREVFVALTPAGKALIRSVTARRRAEIDRIVSLLPPHQRALLAAALTMFAEAAGEIPDDAWKLGWTT